MAQNHSVVDIDQNKEKVGGGAKELEFAASPKNFTPLPVVNERTASLTEVHQSVPLKIEHPEVSQAGVVAHPESIDPGKLIDTPATVDPSMSHFQQAVPLHSAEIDHRSKGIEFNIKNSPSWLKVFKRAFSRRLKKRKELGITA